MKRGSAARVAAQWPAAGSQPAQRPGASRAALARQPIARFAASSMRPAHLLGGAAGCRQGLEPGMKIHPGSGEAQLQAARAARCRSTCVAMRRYAMQQVRPSMGPARPSCHSSPTPGRMQRAVLFFRRSLSGKKWGGMSKGGVVNTICKAGAEGDKLRPWHASESAPPHPAAAALVFTPVCCASAPRTASL